MTEASNASYPRTFVGLDLETSDMGVQMGIIVISATGTAVIVEPE